MKNFSFDDTRESRSGEAREIYSTTHGVITDQYIHYRGQTYSYGQIESWFITSFSDKGGFFTLKAIGGYVILFLIVSIISPVFSFLFLVLLGVGAWYSFFYMRTWWIKIQFYDGNEYLLEFYGPINTYRPMVERIKQELMPLLPQGRGAFLGL